MSMPTSRLGGPAPARAPPHQAGPKTVEQPCRHLAPAGVVNADEQNLRDVAPHGPKVTGRSGSEHDVEGRSLADCALGPGPAAMAVDDAEHCGQADATSREIALAVQPLESAEELVRVDHVEAHPVVAHEHASGAVNDLSPDLDLRHRCVAGHRAGV